MHVKDKFFLRVYKDHAGFIDNEGVACFPQPDGIDPVHNKANLQGYRCSACKFTVTGCYWACNDEHGVPGIP